MAEPVGIALGSIALFSTFIDLVDCFQEAKDFSEDVDIVFTKVNVMKERLDQWSRMVSGDALGEETGRALSARLSEQKDIHGYLQRMRTILDHTVRTCHRYCRRQNSSKNMTQALSCFLQQDAPSHMPITASRPLYAELRQPTTRKLVPLRLKLSWVLTDKKKIEKLMGDLDFLLNNLEKVTENLRNHIISNHGRQNEQGQLSLNIGIKYITTETNLDDAIRV